MLHFFLSQTRSSKYNNNLLLEHFRHQQTECKIPSIYDPLDLEQANLQVQPRYYGGAVMSQCQSACAVTATARSPTRMDVPGTIRSSVPGGITLNALSV